jgi:hypothetical protein
MRKLILVFTLPLCIGAFAQTDTTEVQEGIGKGTLELGVKPGSGLYAEVKGSSSADSVETLDPDTIKITTKKKLIRIITSDREFDPEKVDVEAKLAQARRERRNVFTYWAGVELGLNNWMTPDGSFDLPKDEEWMELETGRSRFFAINFMEQKIEFGSHHAGLLTGLGLEWTSYHLANNVLLAADRDSTYAITEGIPEYSKNKIRQTGLRLPLMFEFNTKKAPLPTDEFSRSGKTMSYNRKGNFHLAFGVVGTWYFEQMYKQKYNLNGERVKDRTTASLNMLPYRAAARVHLGYGGLNLFAEYALTPLFSEGKGPELIPFNVGITLIGFN